LIIPFEDLTIEAMLYCHFVKLWFVKMWML